MSNQQGFRSLSTFKKELHRLKSLFATVPKLDTYKTFLQRKEFFKKNSKFEKYGLTCYPKKVADNFYGCYGKSKEQDVAGVLLDVVALENTVDNRFVQIRGESYEPNKYGGIWVQWETNLNNWDKWQEIDSAIWRLLGTWNSAPSPQKLTK